MKTAIEIKDLSYSYPDGTPALRGLTLDVYEGETLGVIGPNGAGKTTLLFHMNGILQSDSGIRVLGLPMCRDNLKSIRSKVGFVFQDPDDQLFSPTVFDDIAFGPLNLGLSKDEACERVKQALEQVGMNGYEKRTPHHLSSGEKKKLSLATVLSLPCELLILDEPTANLDPRARKNLAQVLKRLGFTAVVASHDLAFVADVCTRVVVLENGRIAAQGVPQDLFADQRLREKYHYAMDLSAPARG